MGCDYYSEPIITIYWKDKTNNIYYLEHLKDKHYNYSNKTTRELVDEYNEEVVTDIIYENNMWIINNDDIINYVKNIKSNYNIIKIEKYNYYYERF